MDKHNIALCGLPGSGKTTVADYLVREYSYFRCSTGDICREVCNLLFNSKDRELLISLTKAIRRVDEDVWVNAALRNAPSEFPIVFDSMRFERDYRLLSERGFNVWEIRCDQEVRFKRLRKRNETSTLTNAQKSPIYDLNNMQPDVVINNSYKDRDHLFKKIDELIS